MLKELEDGVKGVSLSQKVFEILQRDILSGKYKTDEKLGEVAISKELGVSRTPIREALRKLELEGLVKSVHNKGIFVTNISKKDIEDIYVIRSLVEGQGAYWACQNITEDEIEKLEENIYLREYYLEREKLDMLLKLDNEFHKTFYEASDSRVLEHLLAELHNYALRARKMSLNDLRRAKRSLSEHKEILKALKDNNPERARELTTLHIMNSMRSVKEKLRD